MHNFRTPIKKIRSSLYSESKTVYFCHENIKSFFPFLVRFSHRVSSSRPTSVCLFVSDATNTHTHAYYIYTSTSRGRNWIISQLPGHNSRKEHRRSVLRGGSRDKLLLYASSLDGDTINVTLQLVRPTTPYDLYIYYAHFKKRKTNRIHVDQTYLNCEWRALYTFMHIVHIRVMCGHVMSTCMLIVYTHTTPSLGSMIKLNDYVNRTVDFMIVLFWMTQTVISLFFLLLLPSTLRTRLTIFIGKLVSQYWGMEKDEK